MSDTRKLDRTKPYGRLYPPMDGAVFHQDGGYFSPDGDLVWEDRPPTPPKTVQSKVTTVDSETEEVTETTVETVVDEQGQESPRSFVLAWFRDERDAEWFTVRSKAKDAFGRAFTTKDDLTDYLLEKGILGEGDIKR